MYTYYVQETSQLMTAMKCEFVTTITFDDQCMVVPNSETGDFINRDDWDSLLRWHLCVVPPVCGTTYMWHHLYVAPLICGATYTWHHLCMLHRLHVASFTQLTRLTHAIQVIHLCCLLPPSMWPPRLPASLFEWRTGSRPLRMRSELSPSAWWANVCRLAA